MQKALVLLILLVPFILSSCGDFWQVPEKPEDKLPEITEYGANTFGCILNGEIWIPTGRFNIPKLSATYYPPGHPSVEKKFWGALQITTYKENSINRDLIILGHDSIGTIGQYPFQLNDSSVYLFGGMVSFYRNDRHFATTNSSSNILNISRIDSADRIISGTFSFDLVADDDYQDTIKVRNGRFDIRFTY